MVVAARSLLVMEAIVEALQGIDGQPRYETTLGQTVIAALQPPPEEGWSWFGQGTDIGVAVVLDNWARVGDGTQIATDSLFVSLQAWHAYVPVTGGSAGSWRELTPLVSDMERALLGPRADGTPAYRLGLGEDGVIDTLILGCTYGDQAAAGLLVATLQVRVDLDRQRGDPGSLLEGPP